jgi:hypothetical protein
MDANSGKPIKFRFDRTKLKLGTIFYEAGYGMLLKCKVTQDPVLTIERGDITLSWKAIEIDDPQQRTIEYSTCVSMEHYGPKIYLEDEVEYHNGRAFLTR